MNMNTMVRSFGGILLGGVLLFAGGCGYKNAPVPPETVVPQEVADLLYTTSDKGAKLTWSYPVKTIRGSVIDTVSSFDLYRADIPLDDYCGSCPIPFGKPVEVAGGAAFDGKQRRKVSYEVDGLKSGYKYFFKVRSRTSWLAASSDSNIVSFVWMKPVAAPIDVKAIPGDRQVTLKWQPVSVYADGSALDNPIQYWVFRSIGGKDFTKIGEKPITTPYFVDRQVRNGQKYFYAVQSVMVHREDFVDGGRSSDVSAIPVDLTPPVPPSGVTAVSTSVGIKVFWDRSETADLGGYNVYRRSADEDTYTLLGKVEPEFTLFVDRNSSETVRYYYAVTALDNASPQNESSKSREATVRY